MGLSKMNYKKNMNVLNSIWKEREGSHLICPQCKGTLTMIQMDPIYDTENPYTSYKTIIECSSCSFTLETESFTILGSVKDFDAESVELGSWSPSGVRVLSRYKYMVSTDLLQKLKKSGELVEFLIVNNQVVQVIG
jgi:hypothetical protein